MFCLSAIPELLCFKSRTRYEICQVMVNMMFDILKTNRRRGLEFHDN